MLNKENQMIETKMPKGRARDGKINISLNPETVAQLVVVKDDIGTALGFSVSYSQAIQHLIKYFNQRTECQGDTLSQPNGESNE
jgi:hypothetical protein